MRRFGIVFGVLALAVALGGCASARTQHAASPATRPHATPIVSRPAARVTYPDVGVSLIAAPQGYRPALSRAKVLVLLRHTAEWRYIKPKKDATVRVWSVADPSSERDPYPAWVITNQRPGSNCAFVSIYSLRSRVWIWHFHSCTHAHPIQPSCDFGCTPANQDGLDAAAQAAERVVGPAFFAGVAVDDASNTVDVYLAHAPRRVLDRLKATHPGTYVIHNGAPRSLRAVKKVMRSFTFTKLRAEGIKINGFGPTVDGYLQVGVSSHVAEAQAKLNAIYGPNLIRVVKQAAAIAF